MESIISTFHVDWKIIIAQAINFGVVFFVLYMFALKPLIKLMIERTEKIGKGLDDAKTNATTLARTKQEYEEMLTKARVEAQKIFEVGKKEAQAKKDAMLIETKIEVSNMIDNGKKMLDTEKLKMVADAKREVAMLATVAVAKLFDTKTGSLNEQALKELKDL